MAVGEMGEGDQEIQTPSYQISKSWTCCYGMVTTVHNTACILYDSVDMNLSKLWEIVNDRETWRATVRGDTKGWT